MHLKMLPILFKIFMVAKSDLFITVYILIAVLFVPWMLNSEVQQHAELVNP